MSARVAKWLAWSLLALAVVLSITTLVLGIAIISAASTGGTTLPSNAIDMLRQQSLLDWIEAVFGFVAFLAFSALGVVIVSRYPSHVIGWIFCAIGLLGVVEPFAAYYAMYALYVASASLPGGLVAGWFQNWIWVVSSALLTTFLPLLFPTGRLSSGRWKLVWWLAISATVSLVLGAAFHTGPLFNYLTPFDIPNPVGITTPFLSGLAFVLSIVPFGLLMVSMLLAATSLVMRLRRAWGEERRQIKWFAYLGSLLAVLFIAQGIVRYMLGRSSPLFELAFGIAWFSALAGLPIATGLALLKYHLFDIDVIIRRTLVYGTLTVLLAGLYAGLALGLGGVVRTIFGLSEQQPLTVVASTLAVFALAQPLRRGIQTTIDRRFYRRKYDSSRTLAAFGVTLRNETDLGALSERLVMAVQETMQPEHVSLWLRQPDSLSDREVRP